MIRNCSKTIGVAIAFVIATGPAPNAPQVQAATAQFVNQVVIESRSFLPGQKACSIGVFLGNDFPVMAMCYPFEIRSITPGAYVADSFSFGYRHTGRIGQSPLGDAHASGDWPGATLTKRKFPTPSGTPCSSSGVSSYETSTSQIDFTSPDGFLFASISAGDPNAGDSITLAPGLDPMMTSQASFLVTFNVSNTPGSFVIDSVCVRPSLHLYLLDEFSVVHPPNFTAGTVTIECGPCHCQGDPICDGVTNISDVIAVIDRAWRGAPLPCEPYLLHGNEPVDGPTDVDCMGFTQQIDIGLMINVALRGADQSLIQCAGCP